jgi:hypothetical protein
MGSDPKVWFDIQNLINRKMKKNKLYKITLCVLLTLAFCIW